jgi:hypothetical protein
MVGREVGMMMSMMMTTAQAIVDTADMEPRKVGVVLETMMMMTMVSNSLLGCKPVLNYFKWFFADSDYDESGSEEETEESEEEKEKKEGWVSSKYVILQ